MKKAFALLVLNLGLIGAAAAEQSLYSQTFQLTDFSQNGQQYRLTLNPALSKALTQPVVVRLQAKLNGEGKSSASQSAECSYWQQGACLGQTRPVNKQLYQFELGVKLSCSSREVLDKTLFDGEYTDEALSTNQSTLNLDEASVVLKPSDCNQLTLVLDPLQVQSLQGFSGQLDVLAGTSQPGLHVTEIR